MYRSVLLLLAFAFAIGCKKNNIDNPNPTVSDAGVQVNAGGSDAATLQKLQPRAKFKFQGELASHYNPAVQLSDDGKILAIACSVSETKSATKVWTVSGEPKELSEFEGGRFALSPSGKYLVVLGNGAKVYETATQNVVANMPRRFLFSHVFFRDDNTLVCTNRSYNFAEASKGEITIWDVARNSKAESFEIPDNRFSAALPANDRKEIWLFMSNNKFEVECYDTARKMLLRTVKPENDTRQPFTSAGIWNSIASDASVFATENSKLNIYDATTGKIVGALPKDLWGSETGLLPGGTRYLARPSEKITGLSANDSVIFDWKAKKSLAVLTGHSAGQKGPPLAAGSEDGKTLVSVTKDGEGLVFDISSVR